MGAGADADAAAGKLTQARSFLLPPFAGLGFDHVGDGAGARDEGGDLLAHTAHPRRVLTGLERVAIAGPPSTFWVVGMTDR